MQPAGQSFRCRLCGASHSTVVFAGVPDRLQRQPGAFTYVRCSSCGLIQLERTPDNIADYYRDYGRHASESAIYALFRRLVTGGCYVYPRPPAGSNRMLDFGCGNGWYMTTMQRLGWNAHGFEFDPPFAAALAERIGLPVSADLKQLPQDSFDLITLNFVFEHLDQPVETVAALLPKLRPGGTIVIAVPNLAGREAKVFGSRWFHLDAPRHIVHFTVGQLEDLLRRTGYAEVKTTNLPVATGFSGSLSYLIFGHLHPLVWYPAVLPGMLWSFVIRDGNVRTVARRPSRP